MSDKTRSFVDTECYRDYWMLKLMLDNGRTATFELYEGHPLDIERLRRVLEDPRLTHYTFNGKGYDEFQIRYALAGATPAQLKETSDKLIVKDPITKRPKYRPWDLEKTHPIADLDWDHVDLIEVAPGKASLKIYGGRYHCQRMQDLPIEPGDLVCDESPMEVNGETITDPALKRKALRDYCGNDLYTTKGLADALKENLSLRETMMREGIVEDLRSKSDAQIAEVVLKQRVRMATGLTPRKTGIGYSEFQYVPPKHVQYATEPLKEALRLICESTFIIKESSGHVEMPPALDNLVIQVGNGKYKLGLGGLHSQESEVSHYANNDILRDIDVRSYYPQMILNMGMYPDSMGKHFLHAYQAILDERLSAKDAGDKTKDATLKITLNGTFGKTSSKYSVLYNPKMMIYTTITGQLNILMLIEALTRFGIEVVSANTDGIVVKTAKENEAKLRKIVAVWEKITRLQTEETNYRSIHARDVNSYIAVKTDGKIKTKGFFAKAGLQKNPQNEICVDAVIEFLTKGTPFEHTIWDCKDITKFITIRTVDGGAFKEGYILGKAIRWYYGKGEKGVITYKSDGSTVSRTEGAIPLMELPKEFPTNIDYDWYVKECHELLMDIGVTPRPPKTKLPRRNSKAWKQLVEDGMVDSTTNQWIGPAELRPT